MKSFEREVGESPRIRLDTVGGNLRVTGREGERMDAKGIGEDGLTVQEENGTLVISCQTSCTLFVPPGATLDAGTIGGDATITSLRGDLLIRTVGGDLRLRGVGVTAAETVGGDLSARKLGGSLSVDQIAGDAQIEAVSGDVRLRNMGGDLRLSRVDGLVEATIGGDANLSLEPPPDTISSVQAGGDIHCRLPEDASVRVNVVAGGDIRVAVPAEAKEMSGGCEVDLGNGEANLQLNAGGDVVVRTGQSFMEGAGIELGEAIADRVGAEVEAQMAEIEARLGGLGDRIQAFDSERINRKIRQAVARAQKRAAKARRKAARRAMAIGEVQVGREPPSEAEDDAIAEERLMILKMIEGGKISVAEAEKLLSALGD